MRTAHERWFKNAVIYSLSVPHYGEQRRDGMGDLRGVHARLDHLVSLGVTCVWLLPFLASPRRDFGYDVADFYAVDERFGDLGDAVDLIRGAHQRNLRVIVDLPLQHTSVDHPWFRAARASRDDPRHDYYVWRDEPPPREEWPEQIVWAGEEPAPWTRDERAGRWYLHRFYEHEPDVNPLSPALREELHRVLAFWLQLGVDGVRLDAGSHLTRAASGAYDGEPLAFLRELRQTAAVQSPDAVVMVEADVEPERLGAYFEGSEGGVLLFNFFLSNYLFLALARESAEPLRDAVGRLPQASPSGQWANFLRNHDELDLERLSADEREEVFERFAPDPSMRIFGRGIRRRLGPMLGGDTPLLRLAYSALLALPGSPVLLWGDELPLGDDLSRPDRAAVRVPMPWTEGAAEILDPRVRDVAEARREEGSLLNWLAAAIRARREAAPIGWGRADVVDAGDPGVLAIRHDWESASAVVVNNFAGTEAEVALGGCDDLRAVAETFRDREYEHVTSLADTLTVGPHGYRWFRARSDG